ncbi:MAG: hypothetical protein ABIN24_11360 [Dyadobacter sp.]
MKKIVNSVGRLIPAIFMSGMLLISGCQEDQNDVVKKSDLSEVPDSMSVTIGEAKTYFYKNFSSAITGQENKRTVAGNLKKIKLPNGTKLAIKKYRLARLLLSLWNLKI